MSVTSERTQTQKSRIPIRVEKVEKTAVQAEAPKKDKIHISKFLILVNSNVTGGSSTEVVNKIADCLKDGMGKALKEHEDEVFVIKAGAKGAWTEEYIKDIHVKTAAEIGPKYKKVHIHSLVTVKHTTLVQMDAKAIRKYLLEYCKSEYFSNLFVRIKFVPVSDFAELYIEKAPI